MKFNISIRTANSDYTLQVEQINCTKVSEQFVISSLSGKNSVTIQSNRPLFRNKGLKKRKPNFELVEGKVKNQYYLEQAFLQIMQELEPHNYPKPKPNIYTKLPKLLPPKTTKETSANNWGDSVAKLKEREQQNEP